MIPISDLEFRYREGAFRLRIPHLEIHAGSTSAFVGPSGSGKTTLLNLIAGIVLPGKGMVEMDGVEVSAMGDAQRRDYRITTVNYPLQYFAERIGGESVQAEFPAPADGDPAYWQPDPAAITAYQNADLVLLNGAYYAKWVEMAPPPPSKLIDTSASFADRLRGLGVESVVYDPCGNRPASGDFLSVMQENARNLETIFAPGG